MDKMFMEEYYSLKYADTFLTHALEKMNAVGIFMHK